jgi:tetratricopeptide (TPR) repeat protein
LGEFEAAFAFGEAGLAIAREAGDKQEIAGALYRLATVAGQRGENDRPAALFVEALGIYREIGDRHGMASALNYLGLIANVCDQPEQATVYLDEALEIFRALDDRRAVAVTLGNLGRTAIGRGDLNQAAARAQEATALHREVGYKRGEAIELDRLAEVKRRQGDFHAARALHRESLPVWQKIDDPVDLAEWLEQFAALAAADGHPALAARFLGAVHGLREEVGDARMDTPASTDKETTQSVRTALGEDAFHAAWEMGRALSFADVLAQAEAAATNPGEPVTNSAPRRSP